MRDDNERQERIYARCAFVGSCLAVAIVVYYFASYLLPSFALIGRVAVGVVLMMAHAVIGATVAGFEQEVTQWSRGGKFKRQRSEIIFNGSVWPLTLLYALFLSGVTSVVKLIDGLFDAIVPDHDDEDTEAEEQTHSQEVPDLGGPFPDPQWFYSAARSSGPFNEDACGGRRRR